MFMYVRDWQQFVLSVQFFRQRRRRKTKRKIAINHYTISIYQLKWGFSLLYDCWLLHVDLTFFSLWKCAWAHLNTPMFQHTHISCSHTLHTDIFYTALTCFSRLLVPFFAITTFVAMYRTASPLTMQALYCIPLHMIRLVSSSPFEFSVEIWLPPEWATTVEKSALCREMMMTRGTKHKHRTHVIPDYYYIFICLVSSFSFSRFISRLVCLCICFCFLYGFFARLTHASSCNRQLWNWMFQSQRRRRLTLLIDFNKPSENNLTHTTARERKIPSHPTSWWLYLNHTHRARAKEWVSYKPH